MNPGDLIPWAMLAVLVAATVGGLLGRKWTLGAPAVLVALFVLGLWFPVTREIEDAVAYRLHPFPAVLALLMVAVPILGFTVVLGYAVRLAARQVRRAKRPANEQERQDAAGGWQ